MLPKEYRLNNKNDFQRVYQEGRFFSLGSLTVNHVNNKLPISRFGFVVGKKYSKSAVERNYAKRILRSSVATLRERILPGKDFVIGLKKKCSTKGALFKDTLSIVEESFKKNKLLK